jgi:hypothetical protein
LLAVVVLGLASIALIIAFGTSISASSDHRNLATINSILTSTSQQAISEIQQQESLFENCYSNETQTVSAYQGDAQIAMTIPAPYTNAQYSVAYTSVEYWQNGAFGTTCVPNASQLITITLTRNSNGTTYTNTFVVTYPLSSSSASASGTATQLAWYVDPSSTTAAGTAFTTQPVVAVEDATGNPVSTDLSPVVLTITTGTGTLTGCSGNEVLGVVTFTGCTITPDGTYVISASDGNLPTIASPSFTISGSANKLVFTTQPVAGPSGTTFATQPVVEIENSANQVVATPNVTITLVSSGGILSGCGGLTSSTGIFTITGCSFEGGYVYNPTNGQSLPSPYTLTATVTNLVPATSSTFSVSSFGTATQLGFSTEPTGVGSASASAVFTGQPVVTVEDAFGNVVSSGYSTAVTLSLSGSETLGGCSTPSSVNGSFTFTGCHGSAYANGLTMGATSGTLTATSTAFNITGAASKLVFTRSPVAGPSGAAFTSQPIVTFEDSSGNVVTAETAAITLSASGGTLAVCSELTPTLGVVNVASCTFGGTVGTNYTLTAATTGLTSAVSATFTPSGAGQATQLIFTTQPVAGPAGENFTVYPVIKVEDSGGNVVTGSNAIVVLTPSGGVLSPCYGLTAVSGVVNVTNCTFGGSVGTNYDLVATSNGLTQAQSSNFTPSGPGVPAQLVYSTAPPNVVQVNSTFTVVSTEEDAFSNVETGDSSTVVSLAANNGGGGFTCSTVPAHVTSGVATFLGCKYTTGSATPYTLTASSGSLTPVAATMTVLGLPSHLVYSTAPPSSVAAGDTFSVVVNEEDQYSNVEVLDSTTMVSLAANNGGGGFSCTTNPVQVANGVATFSGCKFTVATPTAYTVTASSGTLTTATSTTTVGAGAATKLVYQTAPPSTATAGNTFSVVVYEEDTYGNVETTDSTTTLALAANNGGGGFTCSTDPTQVTDGIATYSGCKYTIASATAYTLTASSGSLTSATATTTVSPASATKLVFSPTPSASVNAGNTFTVGVDEEDQYGNVETSDSTTTLTLAATGGSGFSCATVPTHITNGVALFTGCFYTKASSSAYTLTASSGSLTPATASQTVGAGTATKLIYATAPPSTSIAGNTFSVSVDVEDQYNNIETTDSSTVVSLAANNGGGGFTCSTIPSHDTSGVETFLGCDYTVASTTAFTLTASSGSLTTATANTTVSANTATSIAVTSGQGQSATVGAAFTNKLVATVTDAYGNPINGAVVTFAVPGSGASSTFAGNVVTATTGTNGQATSVVFTANHVSGAYNISATASGTNTVDFGETNVAGAATTIAVTSGQGQSATVGADFTNKLVATVTDQYGNDVSGAVVTFTVPGSGASATFAGNVITATTGTNGQATSVTVSANHIPGAYNITAAAPGTNTVDFGETNVVGAAANIAITSGQGQSATVAGTFTNKLVATVTDQYGNDVSGVVVTFTVPGSGASATFAGNVITATTGSNGQATSVAFTANHVSGAYNISATASGTNTVDFGETNVAGAATKAVVSSGSAGTSTTTNLAITFQLEDQYGNDTTAAGGLTLALTRTGNGFFAATDGATGTATANVTFALGVGTATEYYGDDTAQGATVTAKVGATTYGTATETT